MLRLAGALIHHKFLSKLDDGRYRLGPATFVLGSHYQASLRLEQVRGQLLSIAAQATEALGGNGASLRRAAAL